MCRVATKGKNNAGLNQLNLSKQIRLTGLNFFKLRASC